VYRIRKICLSLFQFFAVYGYLEGGVA